MYVLTAIDSTLISLTVRHILGIVALKAYLCTSLLAIILTAKLREIFRIPISWSFGFIRASGTPFSEIDSFSQRRVISSGSILQTTHRYRPLLDQTNHKSMTTRAEELEKEYSKRTK
ncbi:hypothetical protein ACOSQ2_025593 [Xanthoceras sorbifolium]